MFDNLGTALVQAVGFFGVFGFFVFQLLSDGKKTNMTKLKSPKRKVSKLKVTNEKPKKKGLFGRKVEPVKVIEEPKNKGWFK